MTDTSKMIFVFGSNLSGIHGAGAAKFAEQNRGAMYGRGIGRYGQSYAIPTKDHQIRYTLPLPQIRKHVETFMEFADKNPDLQFQITRIGCGLAGLADPDVAYMFKDAPSFNCWFDEKWFPYLGKEHRYWGTF